jgi:folate-binding Fe-S cluster repair protein YgfZ
MSAVLVESGPDKGAIWHFGEPNNEQKALAKGDGWADLSHRGVISITGKDRLTWLHAITTQNLEKLQVATWIDALILDVQGHVIDQLFLVDDGQSVWIHLEKERLTPVIEYLNKMKFMLEVEVKDESEKHAVLRAPGVSDAIG